MRLFRYVLFISVMASTALALRFPFFGRKKTTELPSASIPLHNVEDARAYLEQAANMFKAARE